MSDSIDKTKKADSSSGGRTWIPNALRTLRNRDYALYWSGIVISMTGSWMQTTGQGWMIWQLTHSKLLLGTVAAAGTLPALFLSLPAGVVADRFNKRKITIITQSLATLQALILAVLTLTNVITVHQIIALSIFSGLVGAFDLPARHSMVIELVGKKDFLNATALGSSAFNGARFIGPAAAGIVIKYYGCGMCFMINAVSFLAVIISLILIRPKFRSESARRGDPMLQQIWESVRYIRRTELMRNLMIMTAIASIFAGQYSVLMPAFAGEVLHRGAKAYGTLLSAAGIGALVAALLVAAMGHRFKQGTLVLSGALMVPLGLFALAVAPNYSFSIGSIAINNYQLCIACLVFIGFGGMLFMAVSNSLIQTSTPDHLRGRVVAFRALLFSGIAPIIGAMQISTLAEHWGIQPAVMLGAVICLISAVFFNLRSREVMTAR